VSRDHAVRALFALHLAPVEFDHVVASQVIRRKFWPPKTCEGAVVGLCASGLVFGEAQLERVESDRDLGGARWHFGPATLYARALQHPASVGSRAMASPMPAAPAGTLTSPRETTFEW